MKNLPIGIHTFCDLVEGDYLYVDKTKDIYNLFAEGGKYYFLSRPRRFGKSLLVSILKEIFSGNRELFKGLWIYDKLKWEKHPVIHLDFLGLEYGSREALISTLEFLIKQNATIHGIQLKETGYDKQFKELITKLSKTGKVVILVDEYDKPIIDFIDKKEIAVSNRDVLKTFYGSIKGADEHLKFVFVTGVSKFSKVSVFSDLNNLRDITISASFCTMLGYTHEELLHYFSDRIKKMADCKEEELIEDIKNWYNGYSWDGKNFVYNPTSILNFFQERSFGNYWFETGTSTFLTKLIRKYDVNVRELDNYRAGRTIFESFEIENLNVASLLFQTGYLTIKKVEPVDRVRRLYTFSYPNTEVKEAFLEHLLGEFSNHSAPKVSAIIYDLRKYLFQDMIETFMETMKYVFADISYDIFIKEKEAYYHTVIYLVLKLVGINIDTEIETNQGRLDAVIETDTHIYIMEFKLGQAQKALNQIKEMKYYEKYFPTSKKIKIIGIGFDVEEKNIKGYLVEDIS